MTNETNGQAAATAAAPAPLPPGGAPRHDQAGSALSPHHTLLIRTAKVVGRNGQALCIIRDASAEEVRIKRFTPLPPGPELAIELPDGQRHAVVQVWEDGDQAGLRFVEPVALERLIAANPAHLRKREISLDCLVPGVLSARSGECDVKLHDISQHGARIECGLHLAMNERVRLETQTLPPLMATIAWRRAPFYRLLFDRVFAFDELARLSGVVGPPPPPIG
ncbi:MAG: PilZ domain-containing protein [Novosphingobium sp.]